MANQSAIQWRYLRRGRGMPRRLIKHALLSDAGPQRLALCGRGPSGRLDRASPRDVWQTDEAGLAERRECGLCAKAVKRRGGAAL